MQLRRFKFEGELTRASRLLFGSAVQLQEKGNLGGVFPPPFLFELPIKG